MFLRYCYSVTVLDVSSNPLGDKGGADIIQSLERESEFEGLLDRAAGGLSLRMSRSGAQSRSSLAHHLTTTMSSIRSADTTDPVVASASLVDMIQNDSLTDLRLNDTGLGALAAGALENSLKTNATLTALHLDFNLGLTPKHLKKILSSIRAYNNCIQRLSFADMRLSVNSAGQIFRVLGSPDVPLSVLALPRSGLGPVHLSTVEHSLGKDCSLSSLDLSGNPIGDDGAPFIVAIMRGVRGADGAMCAPPLKRLDLSGCGFRTSGLLSVVKEAEQLKRLKTLDISDNSLDGVEVEDLIKGLVNADLEDLRMNRCRLKSKGAVLLFTLLAVNSNKKNSNKSKIRSCSLRNLMIAENDIHDSVCPSLISLLSTNETLQNLDISFNKITQAISRDAWEGVEVTSEASVGRKTLELTINLVGNPCDLMMLDSPGLSRSKSTLRYADLKLTSGILLGQSEPLDRTKLGESALRLIQEREAAGRQFLNLARSSNHSLP